MRVINLIALTSVMIGCNRTVGDWEGECVFSDVTVEVELEIEEDTRSGIVGDAEMSFFFEGYEYSCDGEIEGSRDGKTVELELDFEDVEVGGCGVLEIEANLDGDSMSGDCEWGSLDGGEFEADAD